ncbi:MAG: DUF2161 family putative PD-(D/E)XK-type phosphodiesterase [Planctomycetota bacterium]|jgi:hypothetical protein
MSKKKAPPPILEQDLYPPLLEYLEGNGYTVRAEVKDCDVTATKGDDLIVIEMKRTCSIELLIQGTARQCISDSVYVAIPAPSKSLHDKHWRGVQRILKQLELGFIVVYFEGIAPRVEVVFHPIPYQRQKRKAARRAVIEEMAGRSANHNVGGTTRRKRVTAYRENAIHIACALAHFGEMSPKALRALEPSTGPKTRAILYNNVYEWFSRVDHGVYALSAAGHAALDEYGHIADTYREHIGNGALDSL